MTEFRDTQHATARHPISVAAERSELSQGLLRVWEQRYGALTPERGPSGQRLDTNADIERLDLLQVATCADGSISHAAGLSAAALAALVDEDDRHRGNA